MILLGESKTTWGINREGDFDTKSGMEITVYDERTRISTIQLFKLTPPVFCCI